MRNDQTGNVGSKA